MKFISSLTDNTKTLSFSTKQRQKRHIFFMSLINKLPKPIKIIDIGGTENYWKHMGDVFCNNELQITLLNLQLEKATATNIRSIVGNATSLPNIADKEYDVVFSNSVIEHLNTFDQQQMMANEILRIGKSFFIQTPNKFFPIEPHFLFPMFQFLPRNLQIHLLLRYNLGWHKKCSDTATAENIITSINLLNYQELRILFPKSNIYFEKCFGLTKSYIAYGGVITDTSN